VGYQEARAARAKALGSEDLRDYLHRRYVEDRIRLEDLQRELELKLLGGPGRTSTGRHPGATPIACVATTVSRSEPATATRGR
jgi:hypothetical protein